MANTSPTPSQILTAMKDHRCDIKVISSPTRMGHENGKTWETTGKGSWSSSNPLIGVMVHHTAGASVTKENPVGSLEWLKNAVIDGSPLVGAPACNQVIGGYPGSSYILCGRIAYHSGAGPQTGAYTLKAGLNIPNGLANYRLWGIEVQSRGLVRDFTDYQLEQIYRSTAALWDLCGFHDSGKTIMNHKDWAPLRKNDTLYPREKWVEGAKIYLTSNAGKPTEDSKPGDNESKIKTVAKNVNTVESDAVATSVVAGTPQTARFAVVNAGNESVYLSEGDTSVLITSEEIFYVESNVIQRGEPVQISINTKNRNAEKEIEIQTLWVQDDTTAQSILGYIAENMDTQYSSITLSVYGNPLVQLGDFVTIESRVNKISFPANSYFVVTAISQEIGQGGLSTTLTVKPIKETFKVV
jgi:hypothetical protein